MKIIDPGEHRAGITVTHPPAAHSESTYRLAVCAHHPEWGYQAHPGPEMEDGIAHHVQAYADGHDTPSDPIPSAVTGETKGRVVRQSETFTVEQALCLEAARLYFGQAAIRLRHAEAAMADTLRELDKLAAWLIDRTLPAFASTAVVSAPMAPSLDDVGRQAEAG